MLIRSLALILIVASSFILVRSQTPDTKKEGADKAATTTADTRTEKLRDFPFPAGVDLQFIIKNLARDMDLNVIFDSESFRTPGRKVYIDLKNVTAAAALDYVLLQEKLISEVVGPRTIIVASRYQGTSIARLGLGLTPLTEQLADYFGVEGGVLINNVRPDSPAFKAGLKAGDVIVGIEDESVKGAVGLIRAIEKKGENDSTLKIVRDRREQTISLAIRNEIK
jgi:membrane-associated protease RseP (regulator of RpoE activity)